MVRVESKEPPEGTFSVVGEKVPHHQPPEYPTMERVTEWGLIGSMLVTLTWLTMTVLIWAVVVVQSRAVIVTWA